MRIQDKIYIAFQNVLAFLTGGTFCVCCSKPVLSLPLCPDCRKILFNYVPFKSGRRCKKCGKVLVSEIELCTECREKNLYSRLDGLFPINMYQLWKKDLLFAWKSEGQRSLSFLFAELVFAAIRELYSCGIQFDALVPVPPRPGKIREKGWDQIDELTSLLSSVYGLKLQKPLERISSREQKTLSKEERMGSSGAVFKAKQGVKPAKRILLIDDVVTTGSTMEKCSEILKNNGAEEVYALALFMVD